MIKANFKVKLETKVVWAGMYGGHYDVIVFFSKKPNLSTVDTNDFWDDMSDCKHIHKTVIGNMALEGFYELYPNADLSAHTQADGRPKDIIILETFQIELTAPFDEYGNLLNIYTNEDEWNS